jgi:hypothetical protein
MMSRDMAAEWATAQQRLGDEDRAMLAGHAIPPHDVELLIGTARIRLFARGRLFEPDPDGGIAFVSPVRIDPHNPVSPEARAPGPCCRFGALVDLVAWHPLHPDRWALRTDAAEWLGCIEPQYMDPAPVPIRRSVLSWFRAGCTGLVLLSRVPAVQYRLLMDCHGDVIAEDTAHAAKLRQALNRPWPRPRVLIDNTRECRDAA